MRTVVFGAGLSALAFSAGLANADTVKLTGGPGYGGGAFGATLKVETAVISGHAAPFTPFSSLADGATLNFPTFCLEHGEFFTPGTSYFVEYSTSAMFGGTGSGDPLGSATAWLYSQVRTSPASAALQTIFGAAGFDLGNSTHNRLVQEAVWTLEGESFTAGSNATTLANLVALANANQDGSLYSVMVMRMWGQRTWNTSTNSWNFSDVKQDQLVLIPLPSAAWAGMSMIAGVVGFGVIRRRSLRSA